MGIKISAYIPLHYGAEYLKPAIQSIDEFVDKIIVLYTDRPSFGFGTQNECPETEQQLKDIAYASSNKIIWVHQNFGQEATHRDAALRYSEDSDLLLAIDADEVWDKTSLQECLQFAYDNNHRYTGINGFINFWKSFDYACHDSYAPVRITKLSVHPVSEKATHGKVYHFSCALSNHMVRYKWEIHGHKDELRPGWLEIYEQWTPEKNMFDLHPVAKDIWNATPYDKETLPDILKVHPYFNLRVTP